MIDRLPAIARALRQAARRFGTPLYLTDVETLESVAAGIEDAFPVPWIRQFSLKANDVPAIVERVAAHGWGGNVVSRGEWALAHRAGLANERLSLEGIGKTDHDLRTAVRAAADGRPLRWLALESVDEAIALRRAVDAASRRRTVGIDVLFRLNPDVTPETHRGSRWGPAPRSSA